jgi:acetyl esterase/lipase
MREDMDFYLDWDNDTEALSTLRKFVSIQEQLDQLDPGVQERILHAPARDGYDLPLRVFCPPVDEERSLPKPALLVLYYGGGNILGSPVLMAKLARSLVKRFKVIVVAPTYRLAPEHPYPKQVEDGWDALSYIADHAITTLQADPSQGFIVGGISAGGNIANVITHLARDQGLQHPITGNWLSINGVRLAPKDEHKLPPKYRDRLLSQDQAEYINSPTLPSGMRGLIERSCKRDRESHLSSPMIWPALDGINGGEFGHKGMPRTYSQVCGADTGRDELLIYDDMLKNEGVDRRLDIYPGLPHAFWHTFKKLPEAKKWEEDTMEGFRWLLGR